jgi:hypothetical protein
MRFGRPRRSAASRAKETLEANGRRQLGALQTLCSPWIDNSLLVEAGRDGNCRQRAFCVQWTFWAFLYQLLCGLGCRGAVKCVQSWAVDRGQTPPSSNPSAYCQARMRLPITLVQSVFERSAERLAACVRPADLWHGYHVKLIDGTGLSTADTPENQAQWPQSSNMKEGCGFPQINLAGLFCLHTGGLLAYRHGDKHQHELSLWRKLWGLLSAGDLVVGDRAFGSYGCIAALQAQGVQGLYRLHGARKTDWRKGRRLGRRDRLVTWSKSRSPARGWTANDWQRLPETLQIRLVQGTIAIPGFRGQSIILATTLTDSKRYPAAELLALYRRRWSVEVFFRDVKLTLGMDVLASHSPEAVNRELLMYLICYNLIRGLMQAASRRHATPIERISFNGTVDQLSHWLWLFLAHDQTLATRRKRLADFYAALTSAPVPDRPDRVEPRVRKRRPKNYRLMTRPRNTDKPPKAT